MAPARDGYAILPRARASRPLVLPVAIIPRDTAAPPPAPLLMQGGPLPGPQTVLQPSPKS
jgi:hypothetical protein